MKYLVIMLALISGLACANKPISNKDRGYIQVMGSGKTVDEAKSNGFKNAIAIIVGSAVLSENEAVNNKLIKEQIIDNTPPLGSINPEKSGNLLNINNETIINKIKNNEPNISCESKLSFNNIDYIRDENNNDANIDAPKSIQKLEELSDYKKQQRQLENDDIKIVISDQNINLDNFDIQNIDNPEINSLPDLLIDDIEYLS